MAPTLMNLEILLPFRVFARRTAVSRVMAKTGPTVRVAVRRALVGTDLGQLRLAVEREFTALDEREQSVRSALAKLTAGFLHRVAGIHHD